VVALLCVVRRQFLDAVVCYFLFFVVLRPWCYFHSHVPVQCTHRNFVAQHSLSNRNEKIGVDIRAFTLEVCVWLDFYVNYQITGRSALPGVTLL
jgi:hypothetical protein